MELSSHCNARCSGCKRTMLDNENVFYEKTDITLENCEDWFDGVDLTDTKIKACGVLGDPIANPELYEILWFFLFEKKIRDLEISTNGGLRTESYWGEMGMMSRMSEGRMNVHWSIDGATRNDYRENVSLDKVLGNVKSYTQNGGRGIWQFIIFDYNRSEVNEARTLARGFGLGFATRESWRNHADHVKFGSESAKSIDTEKYEDVQSRAYRRNYDKPNIRCRHKEKDEIFITSTGKVFPCCHIHDESVGSYTKHYIDKLNVDFSLHNRGLLDILDDPWYTDTLEKSWDKNHPLHLPRCYLTCGDNGKREVRKIIE